MGVGQAGLDEPDQIGSLLRGHRSGLMQMMCMWHPCEIRAMHMRVTQCHLSGIPLMYRSPLHSSLTGPWFIRDVGPACCEETEMS